MLSTSNGLRYKADALSDSTIHRAVRHHLVVLKKLHLRRILCGEKNFEFRLSHTRRPPFGKVSVGDILWLKESGGPVHGNAPTVEVVSIHPFLPTHIASLAARYQRAASLERSYIEQHAQARFATIIRFGRVERIDPLYIPKSNRHAWVVLSRPPVSLKRHPSFSQTGRFNCNCGRPDDPLQ